jgi:hypothetical protein
VRTCAAIRSSGLAPSAGMPNSPLRALSRGNSIVVPSIAVTSSPFHSAVIPSSVSARSASSSKILRMACSPGSFLACENALAAGTCAPGRNRRPGSRNALASTAS